MQKPVAAYSVFPIPGSVFFGEQRRFFFTFYLIRIAFALSFIFLGSLFRYFPGNDPRPHFPLRSNFPLTPHNSLTGVCFFFSPSIGEATT